MVVVNIAAAWVELTILIVNCEFVSFRDHARTIHMSVIKLSTTFLLSLLLVVFFIGCTSTENMHTQTVPDAGYRAALARTVIEDSKLPAAGSPAESALLAGILDLFKNYTAENLAANVTKVYAEQVYFRDAFKQLDSAAAIEHYLLAGLEPIEAAEFVFSNVLRKNGDFYLDWTMRLDFKKTPAGTWEESIGMTRIRFNQAGQVVFHQDYWDPTDIVYRRIPIVKQLIAYVKQKL